MASEIQSRIHAAFDRLKKTGKIALMPFIPAGYPDLPTTAAVIPALESGGASLIEIGFPFSDPIADGPTIQAAFTEALAKKLKVADIFATIKQVRPKVSIPLVAMVSYSIVFRYGVQKFLGDAKSAGFDGLILPDLPPPEAESVCKTSWAAGLDTILLIAPTTTPARRAEIARLSSGFIYYLSVSGITGERNALPPDLAGNVAAIKQLTARPVCVGFGLHTAAQVADLGKIADGAIIGSAVVKRMKQHVSEGPEGIARVVGEYCRELIG
jgi:tryptophan synthase alpha chain